METYLALLRGINVGGKNKVPMPALKSALEGAGFTSVRTYINSGNVLFCAEGKPKDILQQVCRQAIAERFGLEIPVAVVTAGELSDALSRAPDWWDRGPASKHIAIFAIHPADAGGMAESVGTRPEYEQVACCGPVIFWSAPIKTFSRTRWSKVIGTAAYADITIRNANTTKKLLVLAGEGAGQVGHRSQT